MNDIGHKIQECRKEKGWTQEKLAQKMGISRATVAQYEAGKRKPKYETIVRFADALGTSTDNLLGQFDDFWGIKDSVELEAFELNRIIQTLGFAVAGVRTEEQYKMWLACHDEKGVRHYDLSYSDMRRMLDDILSYSSYILEKYEKEHKEIDILTSPHFIECEIAGKDLLYPQLTKLHQRNGQTPPGDSGTEK